MLSRKNKKPNAFQNSKASQQISSPKKKSRPDAPTFKQWFYTVFIPYVCRHTSAPVALVVDNFGPHGTVIIASNDQVSFFTLPPELYRNPSTNGSWHQLNLGSSLPSTRCQGDSWKFRNSSSTTRRYQGFEGRDVWVR